MRTRGKLFVMSLTLVALMTNALWAVYIVPPVETHSIYVDDTAPGLNNGTSWFHAYRSLQDALLQAEPDTVIRVAQGVYSPDDATGIPSQGRDATFELKDRVAILGGFAGFGMPFPNERLIQEYETILNGDLDANDMPLDPNTTTDDRNLQHHATRQDNSYSVVTSIGNDETAVLDGFTVINGNANGDKEWPYQDVRGGGMYVLTGTPTILNCLFALNAAADAGGAVCNYSSNTTIMDCNVIGNFTSNDGAGIFNTASEPNIIGCDFIMNSTDYGDNGGGILNYDSAPLIDDCLFKDNFGGGQGGAIVSQRSEPNVMNSFFIGNRANIDGGAVSNSRSVASFTNCSFYSNSAWDNGGAMNNHISTVEVTNCTFNGNSADEHGGAIHSYSSEPNYTNCIFSGNVAADNGGALSLNDCDAQIVNCTFHDNNSVEGRGIACHNIYNNVMTFSYVMVHNSILWHDSNNIDILDGSQVFVLYSDVSGGYPGPGNIALNPQFANPLGLDHILGTSDDNLRILSSSPCIDAAQNYAVPAGITTDREGSIRFFDAPGTPDTGLGDPFDPIVDMGAYEFGSVNPYQDTNDVDGGGGGVLPPNPPVNQAPVANAGPDQLVFAWINNAAQVTLDGTGSYDPEGALLNYSWNWIVNGTTYMTAGATPVILLPVGTHTINLIVGDGQLLSAPDQVQITVIQPVSATLTMFPGTIQRGNCTQIVYGIVNIPQTSLGAVDISEPLTLYPGNVKAIGQSKYASGNGSVGVIAQFDKDEVTSASPANGPTSLTVIGKFVTGQSYAGTDQVVIINCQ